MGEWALSKYPGKGGEENGHRNTVGQNKWDSLRKGDQEFFI